MNGKRFLTVSMGVLLATLQGCVSQKAPRNDLEALLMRLERSTVKVKEPVTAMCYVIAEPTGKEYVCPVCHKRTKYVPDGKGNSYSLLSSLGDLTLHRNKMRELKPLAEKYGLEVSLDERDFCPNCTTDEKGYSYYLVVKDAEGRTVRSQINRFHTYPMLKAFFEGKETYETFDGNEYRLKDSIPEIKKILGLGYLDEK